MQECVCVCVSAYFAENISNGYCIFSLKGRNAKCCEHGCVSACVCVCVCVCLCVRLCACCV